MEAGRYCPFMQFLVRPLWLASELDGGHVRDPNIFDEFLRCSGRQHQKMVKYTLRAGTADGSDMGYFILCSFISKVNSRVDIHSHCFACSSFVSYRNYSNLSLFLRSILRPPWYRLCSAPNLLPSSKECFWASLGQKDSSTTISLVLLSYSS